MCNLLNCLGFLALFGLFWLLTMFWLTRYITPLPRHHQEFNRARRLLWWYIAAKALGFHPSAYMVERGNYEEKIPPGFFAVRLMSRSQSPVLVRSDSVAVIQLFVEPSRVVGNQAVFIPNINRRRGPIIEGDHHQGTTIYFLEPFERIRGVVDLRPQRKISDFKAITSDNMEVELRLLLDLSLADYGQRGGDFYYRYEPAELLSAFYLQGPSGWDERAFSIAKAGLMKVVSRYTLGDLYGNSHEIVSSEVLEEGLGNELRDNFWPYRINSMRVILHKVPSRVMEYSLRNWEVSVEIREKPWEAKAEATYWRQVSEARFNFLQDIVKKIAEVLTEVTSDDLEMTLTMRLTKIVEELAYSLASKGLLTPDTARALEKAGVFKALLPGGN